MMPITIRLSENEESGMILNFIAEMGFNSRSVDTWNSLSMCAITAWIGDKLIGAIPLEPRLYQIAPGQNVLIVHETAVAMHPKYRGGGIGSRMQNALEHKLRNGAGAAMVFRSDESSGPYRWYVRNGFSPILHIESWFMEEPASLIIEHSDIDGKVSFLSINDPSLDWRPLVTLWEKTNEVTYGGFVNRKNRRLQDWLACHPYGDHYEFLIMSLQNSLGDITAYALLGTGTMHSETPKIDILETAIRDDSEAIAETLIRALARFAVEKSFCPIRWPLAVTDPCCALARDMGFKPRLGFDIMARPLSRKSASWFGPNITKNWRYFSVDFI